MNLIITKWLLVYVCEHKHNFQANFSDYISTTWYLRFHVTCKHVDDLQSSEQTFTKMGIVTSFSLMRFTKSSEKPLIPKVAIVQKNPNMPLQEGLLQFLFTLSNSNLPLWMHLLKSSVLLFSNILGLQSAISVFSWRHSWQEELPLL